MSILKFMQPALQVSPIMFAFAVVKGGRKALVSRFELLILAPKRGASTKGVEKKNV